MLHNVTSTDVVSIYKHAQIGLFTTQVHPDWFPFAWLDVLGAIRLSYFIDQFVRQSNGIKAGDNGTSKRPTFLQEAFGLLMLIFGGETFLAAILQFTPSWLLSVNVPLLFVGVHYVMTRILSIGSLVPKSLIPVSETLVMPFFDCLGRALVLSTFTVDIVLAHPDPKISSSPLAMCWAAWIAVVPFASLAFACNMFKKEWSFSTPPELQTGGWKAVDVWSPPLIAMLYGALAQIHPTFSVPYQALMSLAPYSGTAGMALLKGLPSQPPALSREDAKAVCAAVLSVLYLGRAVYNFGPQLLSGLPHVGFKRETSSAAARIKARASPKVSSKKVKQKTQ